MHRNNVVLLIIGLLMLAKTLWAVISPDTFKKGVAWVLGKLKHVNTLTGYSYILIGVVLLILVLLEQPLVNWLLVALGAGCIYAGSWLFDMERVDKKVKSLVIDRGTVALRVMGVVGLILAGLVIYVSIFRQIAIK
jgi:hypothetical protein